MKKDADKVRSGIANRLRQARDAAGLTQGQAAKKLDLHRPAVSEIEAGRRRVSAEELAALADLYGVHVDWLTGTDIRKNGESDKIVLAARQLSKLKDRDLDRLLSLVHMLRGSGRDNDSK